MESLTARNAWILSVEDGKRRIGVWTCLLIAVVAILCGVMGGPLLYGVCADLYRLDGAPTALSRALYYGAVFFPLYACAFASRFWEKRAALHGRLKGAMGLVLGLAVGGLAFLSAVLAILAAGGISAPETSQGGLRLGIVLAAALTAFQAFGEEFFFRGWLQPILAADWGIRAGLVVTAAIFAGAHLFSDVFGPVAILNLFLAGLVFGLLALRSGGLAAPFGAHWIWNWLEQSVMGLVPNPGVDSMGSFFDFDLVGPALLSGGADGLNGSLVVSAVLLAVATGLYLIPAPSAQEGDAKFFAP